jgi:ERCC4-type nuclease
LFQEDGLTVLGRGLGLEVLFGKFLRLYAEQRINQRRDLVLCLNTYGKENSFKTAILSDGGHPEKLPKVINNEVTPQERIEMYAEGGCYFITTRILIVDLLDQTLDPVRISGLLIYDAHRISETSIESFVLRVFRDNNRTGFIKGFSEDPEMIQGGFSKVERIMRTLFLKKLYLWPRFRLEIAKAIEQRPQPEVTELKLQVTSNMRAIQNAILVCLNSCLSELKKSCPTLEAEQLTLENGLFSSFDSTIRSQLDPDWHRVSIRTKSIINDLGVLRKLLDYLIRYDAFSFYYLLLKLQATSSSQSMPALWLMTDAANMIFQHAKERVHQVVPIGKSNTALNQRADIQRVTKQLTSALQLKNLIQPVLECPPKWAALMQIMNEVSSDFAKAKESKLPASGRLNTGRVLLIARDELAASQLRDCLMHGTKYVMDARYRWFVSQQCAEIRRKSYRLPRNSSDTSFQQKKSAIPLSRSDSSLPGAGTAPGGIPGDDDDVAQKLFSERNVRDLLHQEETLEPSNQTDFGGYCDLGLSENTIRQFPLETQLLLVQERLLKLTPPIPSKQQRWQCTPSADAFNSYADVSAHEDPEASGKKSRRDSVDDQGISHRDTIDLVDDNVDHDIEDKEEVIDLDEPVSGKKRKFIPLKRNSLSSFSSRAAFGKGIRGRIGKGRYGSSRMGQQLMEGDDDDEEEESDDEVIMGAFVSDELLVHVVTHNHLREHWSLLRDFQPETILLYDADVRIIRQIEVYQSTMPVDQPPVRVFFFAYQGSTEEHRYVASLAKEKKAFEALILTKEHLVVSLPDNPFDIRQALSVDASLTLDSRTVSQTHSITVPGAGVVTASTALQTKRKQIVVDVREFRSSLPPLLHISQQWKVVPRTLHIGDYVLAPEICVERKGISDLFQSFASGRLYNQVEAMSRYYRHPCLLIEFQVDKPFCLVTPGDLGSSISPNSIVSKLVLLTQSFPHLRILWSRSPQQTVDIFRTISLKHEEADVEKAVTVGSALEGNEAGVSFGVESGQTNQELRLTAQEILLSLPGINVHNFRDVMHHVTNLAELSALTEAELLPLIGPVNAPKLRKFFTQRSG